MFQDVIGLFQMFQYASKFQLGVEWPAWFMGFSWNKAGKRVGCLPVFLALRPAAVQTFTNGVGKVVVVMIMVVVVVREVVVYIFYGGTYEEDILCDEGNKKYGAANMV